MNARDELEPPFLVGVTDDFPGGNDDDLVEWAFEAGTRYQQWHSKPRTITTAEELDALHAKAVILDPNGTPWVCDGDMVEPWASVCEDPFGGPIWKNNRDIALPATVIHEP